MDADSCENVSLMQFTTLLAEEITVLAYQELEKQSVIGTWTNLILSEATKLFRSCVGLTSVMCSSAVGEGMVELSKRFKVEHKIIPWAEKSAENIVKDVCELSNYSSQISLAILDEAWKCLGYIFNLRRMDEFATSTAQLIMKSVLSEETSTLHNRTPQVDQSVSSLNSLLDEYAETMAKEVLGERIESEKYIMIPSARKVMKWAEHANFNSNNNYMLDDSENSAGIPTLDVSSSDGVYQSYAEDVVMDLICYLKNSSSACSQSSQQKSSLGESCESISSDLLSPRSTADSRGLHHFADKLLYSLSVLENDHLNNLPENKVTLRRSSAPELRGNSSRRSSLRTVFESKVSESSSKLYWDNPRFHQICHILDRKRYRSVDGGYTSHNDTSCDAYCDILTRDILYSAYKNV